MKVSARPSLGFEAELSQLSHSGKPVQGIAPRKKSLFVFLAFVIFNTIVFNFAIFLFDHYVVPQNPDFKQQSSQRELLNFVKGIQGKDSLQAMLPAMHILQKDSRAPVYQFVFFHENHVRFFQYPLTSLLPLLALQQFGVSDAKLILLFKIATFLSVCLTVLLTIRMAWQFLPRDSCGKPNRLEATLVGLGVGLSGLLFYPMMRGASLGQVQTTLTLGFTLAFYCWMSGRERATGAIIGVMILIKPQYVLFFSGRCCERNLERSGWACPSRSRACLFPALLSGGRTISIICRF